MDWYEWTAAQQSVCSFRTIGLSNRCERCSEHPSMCMYCDSVHERSSVRGRRHQSTKAPSYGIHSRISISRLGRCWICHRLCLRQISICLSSARHIHIGECSRATVRPMHNTVQKEMECTIVQTRFLLYGTNMCSTLLGEVPLHCSSEHTWYIRPLSSKTCSCTTASSYSLRYHCIQIIGDSVRCHRVRQKKER